MFYRQYGSYRGEWLMMTRGESAYQIIKDSYGSCFGCDSYGVTFGWNGPALTRENETVRKFCEEYKPFAEVPIATMINLVKNGTLRQILPKNVQDYGGDINYDETCADIALNVKLIEKQDFTATDILACTNAELQQEALKLYGYERFLADVKADTLHTDGENTLVSVGEIKFVSVKDASTNRRYLLRVPPQMKRTKEAIAWTFGLDESQYKPSIET